MINITETIEVKKIKKIKIDREKLHSENGKETEREREQERNRDRESANDFEQTTMTPFNKFNMNYGAVLSL